MTEDQLRKLIDEIRNTDGTGSLSDINDKMDVIISLLEKLLEKS